jgi:hypothetical protein
MYCSYLKLLVGGECEPRLLGPAPAAPPRPHPLQGGGGGVGGIDNARSRALATDIQRGCITEYIGIEKK